MVEWNTSIKSFEFSISCGIQLVTTNANTLQQIGIAIRMNRTLLDLAPSMLNTKTMSNEFCVDAAVTAAYIRNEIEIGALSKKATPRRIWLGTITSVKHLRIF